MTKGIRAFVVVLVAGLALAISCSAWAAAQIRAETKTVYYSSDLKIVVDGRQTILEVEPFIIDPGWIMVPAEFISKELGASVAWDGASSTFTITTKGDATQKSTSAETITWPTGDKYVGQVSDGKPSGQGVFTWVYGDTYSGEWKNGLKCGQGTYKWANGDTYSGEFRDDLRHGLGTGTQTFPTGDKYVGEYRDGKPNGQGTFMWANGDKYVGAWKDGLLHGLGTYAWAKGDTSSGEWKDNVRDGLGTYTFSNGDKFVGEYRNDSQNGVGAYQWADGHVQAGLYSNGVLVSTEQPVTTGTTVPSSPDVIESVIEGTFEGWSGDTIFKLANGQIWQQASYAYTYHYAYRPEVVIYRSGLVYKMRVEGVNTVITVKRLK